MIFSTKNNIFHMASMARSGETLMLKILAVHPQLKIVHNLDKTDNRSEIETFEYLKKYKKTNVSKNHKLIKQYNLKKNDILIIKQGVWEHPFPFNGFVLSRNPISIYSSLKNYDKDEPDYDSDNNYWPLNEARLIRWLKDMNPKLLDGFEVLKPIEQFTVFYNYRMSKLYETALPIIRYEDLIVNTKQTLEKVCDILGVSMAPQLLNSHEYYDDKKIGHGKNILSRPIDTGSLEKYTKNITDEEFQFIAKNTVAVFSKFGYKIEDGKISF